MPSNPRLDAAIHYARAGIAVLPTHSILPDGGCSCRKECRTPGKHPRTKDGVKDASADLDQIKDWWWKWPDANVAICPGEIPGTEFSWFVLDVDTGTEKEGGKQLKDLEEAHGQRVPRKLVQRTGGGGRHILLKIKTGERAPRRPAPHIDIKADGGYILAEPSNHRSGDPYEWESCPPEEVGDFLQNLPTAPEWLWDDENPTKSKNKKVNDDDLAEFVRQQPIRDLSDRDIEDYLLTLPAGFCDEYHEWLEVGAALHHQFEGKSAGLDMWHWFSKRSKKYDPKALNDKWRSFGRNPSPVTLKSLIKVSHAQPPIKAARRVLNQAESYRDAVQSCRRFKFMASEIPDVVDMLAEVSVDIDGRKLDKRKVERDLKEVQRDHKKEVRRKGRTSFEIRIARGILERYYANGNHLLRFSDGFWAYDGGVWAVIPDAIVKKYAVDMITERGENPEEGEDLDEVLTASDRLDTINGLSESVTGVIAKLSTTIERDPFRLCQFEARSLINCKNVLIAFDDGKIEIKDHDPKLLLTQRIDAEYDPMAECPRFDKALCELFAELPDGDDVIRHLWEFLGYVLQTSRSHSVWTLFHGGGGNGKTFVAEILQKMVGPESVVSNSITEFGKNTHDFATLIGKVFFYDDDFEANAYLPDGTIKKMSEEKLLTCNPKNMKAFPFISRVVPLILSNHWPRTRDNSVGMTRRAMIFPFRTFLTKYDRTLKPYIFENEMSGVLNHAIKGWMRVQKRGDWKHPVSCKEAFDTWSGKRNNIAAFISDCIELTGSSKDKIRGKDLFGIFLQWAGDNNSGERTGRNTFFDQIGNLRGVSLRTTHGNKLTFFGLRIHYTPEIDDRFDDLEDVRTRRKKLLD